MNRRSAIMQLFFVGSWLSILADKSSAVERIYPQSFHQGGDDWTSAFQAAINPAGGKQVYVKKGTYNIKPIYFISNVKMYLAPGVVINRYGAYPGTNDCIFNLGDVSNIKKCTVINSKFLNTSGTAPAAGIDLEPDTPDEFMENVVIRNCFQLMNCCMMIFINLSLYAIFRNDFKSKRNSMECVIATKFWLYWSVVFCNDLITTFSC